MSKYTVTNCYTHETLAETDTFAEALAVVYSYGDMSATIENAKTGKKVNAWSKNRGWVRGRSAWY